MEPLVSIIVVNWNGKEFIQQCIESILNQSYSRFEICLVDNGSTDDSVELVEKKFPQVKIIRNEKNLGFAEGNNIGINHSKSEFIALINPDVIIEKNWLSNLVPILQSSGKICGVAGKQFYLGDNFGKNAVFCTWSKINPYSASPYNFHDDEPVSNVDYLTGAAMMIKREIVRKVGLMDSGYFLYFDETDWCARMIRGGYDLVYVPTAISWHAVSGLVSDSSKKIYYMERSRIRFALKNFDILFIPIFDAIFAAETIYVIFRDIKNRNFSRTKIRLKVIGWNIKNLGKTFQQRKKDFEIIQNNSKFNSYNRSLPLRNLKTGNDQI